MAINGMAGKLPTSSYCSSFTPNFSMSSANMFISKEFIQNFAETTFNDFPAWKNLKIDNSTSDILQFYLADLEYVVGGLYDDLAPFYQNSIYFTCGNPQNNDTDFDLKGNLILQTATWQCYSFIKLNESL